MGKRIEKVLALAIVLLYQLVYSNFASAGVFDWLTNNDENQDPFVVEAMKENRLSYSEDIWQHMKTVLEIEKEEINLKVLSPNTVFMCCQMSSL